MKKLGKVIFAACAIAVTGTFAFAEDNLYETKRAEISDGMTSFADSINIAIPDAASMQNNWSNAFIGTIYPGFKFGFGASVGGTQLDMTGFKSAANALTGGIEYQLYENATLEQLGLDNLTKIGLDSIPDTFILPTASVDVRIGGLFLPFDIGLCAMMTAPSFKAIDYKDPASLLTVSKVIDWSILNFTGTVNYTSFGADLRYCLYEGNLIIPKIALGGGYYYVNGSFAVNSVDEEELDNGSTQTTKANMGLSYISHVGFANLELSKSFGAFDVFLGGKALLSKSETSWSWIYSSENSLDASLNYEDSDAATQKTEDTLDSGFLYDKDAGTATLNLGKIQPQVYLGLGTTLGIFSISLDACADIRSIYTAVQTKDVHDFIWSGALQIHFTL